jgi:hypothetical protein
MFTKEDILEYTQELSEIFAQRDNTTYLDCEATFIWLMNNRKDLIENSLKIGELTEEQFIEIENVFDKLVAELQTLAIKARDNFNNGGK